ncbi:hypothetical protein QFC21_000874 [Naganishia friedmannii]|uniref:Uncharacterized protein n=1 Tax=Naganishia friedmannii TaxID=89922 RepID=A0ACC2W6R6_9TREE|nr:hypothetical protein QFC21_000874 [Naganishia friedmannii]
MAPTRVYLSIARGDSTAYSSAVKAHQEVTDWLSKNASNYGLPVTMLELDEVQKETVQSMYEGENPGKTCLIDEPESLVIGRLVFELSDKPNFAKFVQNFEALCTGTSGHGFNKKALCYKGTPIHRYVPKFVLQGGDVTRFDGSGGESVFGGAMTDPKSPYTKHAYGTLSMASGSAKNSSTSQFFICLVQAGSPEAAKKLDGKYFVFGQLVEGEEVLRKLESELEAYRSAQAVKTGESTGISVWIEDCGSSL